MASSIRLRILKIEDTEMMLLVADVASQVLIETGFILALYLRNRFLVKLYRFMRNFPAVGYLRGFFLWNRRASFFPLQSNGGGPYDQAGW